MCEGARSKIVYSKLREAAIAKIIAFKPLFLGQKRKSGDMEKCIQRVSFCNPCTFRAWGETGDGSPYHVFRLINLLKSGYTQLNF